MRSAIGLTILVLIAGCAPSYQGAGSDTIAAGYTHGGGEWSSGGGITAVTRVFGRDGRTVVCGAWMMDRQSVLSIRFNEDVLAAASVFAGNKRVLQDLRFMPQLPFMDNLVGRSARCVFSPVPWTDAFADAKVRTRFPRMTFGGGFGAGIGVGIFAEGDVVTFREAARPNPIGG